MHMIRDRIRNQWVPVVAEAVVLACLAWAFPGPLAFLLALVLLLGFLAVVGYREFFKKWKLALDWVVVLSSALILIGLFLHDAHLKSLNLCDFGGVELRGTTTFGIPQPNTIEVGGIRGKKGRNILWASLDQVSFADGPPPIMLTRVCVSHPGIVQVGWHHKGATYPASAVESGGAALSTTERCTDFCPMGTLVPAENEISCYCYGNCPGDAAMSCEVVGQILIGR